MAKKATKRVQLTELENALLNIDDSKKKLSVSVAGTDYEISILNHIDTESKKVIVNSADIMYFQDGNYDKVRGDLIMSSLIFSVYTGMNFGNDVNIFDKIRTTDTYKEIVANYPEEVSEIWNDVHDRVEYLKNIYAVPNETRELHSVIAQVIEGIPDFVLRIEDVLDAAAKSFSGDNGSQMSDILKALQELDKKDEKKITTAILDYQAKKEAKGVKKGSALKE